MGASSHKKIALLTALICLGVCWALPVHAQMDPNAVVSRIMHVYQEQTGRWGGVLQNYALGLFWALAGIEFSWSVIKLALKNADLSEFLAELVNRIMYIGFFLALLLHSSDWATAIVESFRTAADAAGSGQGISPGNILEIAMQIITKLLHNTNFLTNPVDGLISGLCAISILLCFGLMSANMIEALIESYVVISAGVLMMGFGGSGWTNDFAKKMMLHSVSVGAKLFLIQLIMGLGEQLIEQLGAEFDGSKIEDALVMVGVAVIMWMISLNVPNKLQGLINGSSVGQGGFLAGIISGAVATGVGMAMAGTVGGAKAVAGGLSASLGAAELTKEQHLASGQDGAQNPLDWMGAMGKNMQQAGISNLGQRFRGDIWNGHMGAQMGHQMRQEAQGLRAEREENESKQEEKESATAAKPEAPGSNDNEPSAGNRVNFAEDA
jgi:type IV secretion system protein TrbL